MKLGSRIPIDPQLSHDGGSYEGGGDDEDGGDEERGEEEEGEEDILVTATVHSTHDAMDLLFQAAERVGRLSPIRRGDEDEGGGDECDEDDEAEDGGGRGQADAPSELYSAGNTSAVCSMSIGHNEGGEQLPEERMANAEGLRTKSASPQLNRRRKPSGQSPTTVRRRNTYAQGTGGPNNGSNNNQTQLPPQKNKSHRASTTSTHAMAFSAFSGAPPAPLNLPPASATPWLFPTLGFLSPNPEEETLSRALEAWSRFKFCHLKWLTPLEAFTYINHFHTHLLPLSPILSPHFALPSAQHELLTKEPLLTMTILTIAARYCPLSGGLGRAISSRGVYLHGRFWQFTQSLVGRVIWGQDRGSGKIRGKDTKGLRGLGTVEALLLWTEWHPRALHFPPVEVGGEEEMMGAMGIGLGLSGDGVERGGKSARDANGWDVSLVVPDSRKKTGDETSDTEVEDEEREVSQSTYLLFSLYNASSIYSSSWGVHELLIDFMQGIAGSRRSLSQHGEVIGCPGNFAPFLTKPSPSLKLLPLLISHSGCFLGQL